MRKKGENTATNYIMNIYLFLMLFIFPLYVQNGFYNIGDAKKSFFLWVSGSVFVILLAIGCFNLIKKFSESKRRRTKFSVDIKSVTLTEWLMFGYMAIIVLSYLFSEYKYDVLWGTQGWYLGTIPLILMSGLAVYISRNWKSSKAFFYGVVIVSAIVFSLGICNRFSFYPIPIEPQLPHYISTLGNINWFCGYMSVTAPIGISLFVLGDTGEYKNPWIKRLVLAYVLLAFMTGFAQGSSSVFLWNGAMFYILLWIAIKNMEWLRNWTLIVALWGAAGQLVRLLKFVMPDRFNYEGAVLIDTNLTLVVAIVAAVVYAILILRKKEKSEVAAKIVKAVHILILTVLIVSVLLWVILSVYNTHSGVSFLYDNAFFTWDAYWGNNRGASIGAALAMFGDMPFVQKIIGVGADGFSAYAYSAPGIMDYLNVYFGESVLTNAHCELITNLVNLGVIGTALYIGIFGTFFVKCMKVAKEKPLLYIPAVCVVCYFANNLISFAQIYNITFLFIMLGMGTAFLKEEKTKR